MEKQKVVMMKTEKGFILAKLDEDGKYVPCEDQKLVLEEDGMKIVTVKKDSDAKS